MKTTLIKQVASIVILLAASATACSDDDKTGTCTTNCVSKANGTNYGDVTYENYTKKECEEALNNRQTILTECTMDWD